MVALEGRAQMVDARRNLETEAEKSEQRGTSKTKMTKSRCDSTCLVFPRTMLRFLWRTMFLSSTAIEHKKEEGEGEEQQL